MIDIASEERTALERFRETTIDDGCYDLPKCMMKRLAEIGLLQHLSRSIYRITEFGLFVLEDGYNRVQAAIDRDFPKRPIIRPMGWIDFNADHCPNCDTQLHEYTDKDVTFCYSCGQRLDWNNLD